MRDIDARCARPAPRAALGTICRIVAPARVRRGAARSSNPSLTQSIHHSHGSGAPRTSHYDACFRRRPAAKQPFTGTLGCDRLPDEARMDDSCLKYLERGNRPGGAADCRPCARGRRAGPVLARRLQVRHAGHQGRGARRLGRPQRPRHGPLRLFRPRRIRRDLHRGHHRPLAGGKRRGISRLLPRAAGRDRLVHGRLARAAAGARARAAGAAPAARRSRAWS